MWRERVMCRQYWVGLEGESGEGLKSPIRDRGGEWADYVTGWREGYSDNVRGMGLYDEDRTT